MGTSWSIKFAAEAPPTLGLLTQTIESALQRVIAQMSSWDATSVLCRFHRSPIGTWTGMPADMAHVVKSGLRIAKESGGAYDMTLGRLVDLWGFGPAGPRANRPSPGEITAIHPDVGTDKIELSPDGGQLRRLTNLHLDLSGIAKGFAVDLVTRTLQAEGITDCLVEIGGELRGLGVKPDGTPWWVDIDLQNHKAAPVRVGLHELAIATSGSERAFHHDGTEYTHTLDPHTGWPVNNGMIAATVLHTTCMEADAYATALMVMGPDHAIAFADAQKLAALIRYREPSGAATSEQMSSAFRAMLG